MAKDLRTFLSSYEKDHPEDVIRIEKELNTAHECTAIARHFEDLNGSGNGKRARWGPVVRERKRTARSSTGH